MVEEADEEVTCEIGDEECPVVIGHGLRSVEQVVDGINPHEASVIEQVHNEVHSLRGGTQVLRQAQRA